MLVGAGGLPRLSLRSSSLAHLLTLLSFVRQTMIDTELSVCDIRRPCLPVSQMIPCCRSP